MSEYRNTIKKESLTYDDLVTYGYDDGKESLVSLSAVEGIINTIEDDVNELVRSLEDIEELSDINTVKSKLKELSYKLY